NGATCWFKVPWGTCGLHEQPWSPIFFHLILRRIGGNHQLFRATSSDKRNWFRRSSAWSKVLAGVILVGVLAGVYSLFAYVRLNEWLDEESPVMRHFPQMICQDGELI